MGGWDNANMRFSAIAISSQIIKKKRYLAMNGCLANCRVELAAPPCDVGFCEGRVLLAKHKFKY